MSYSWGYGGGAQFVFQPQVCPICHNPANLVIQRDKIITLLEAARKLTHPDAHAGHPDRSEKAGKVTAEINRALDEFRQGR